MFGIGSTELLVILVVALLVLGPRNLPKVAQTLGRAMGEFRRVSTEFQRTLNTEIAFEEKAEALKEAEAAKAREKAETGSALSSVPDSAQTVTPEKTAPSAPASATQAGGAEPEEKA